MNWAPPTSSSARGFRRSASSSSSLMVRTVSIRMQTPPTAVDASLYRVGMQKCLKRSVTFRPDRFAFQRFAGRESPDLRTAAARKGDPRCLLLSFRTSLSSMHGSDGPALADLMLEFGAARFTKIVVSGTDGVMAIVIIRPGDTERQLISPGLPVSTSFDLGSTIEVMCFTIKKLFSRRDWRRAEPVELQQSTPSPSSGALAVQGAGQAQAEEGGALIRGIGDDGPLTGRPAAARSRCRRARSSAALSGWALPPEEACGPGTTRRRCRASRRARTRWSRARSQARRLETRRSTPRAPRPASVRCPRL